MLGNCRARNRQPFGKLVDRPAAILERLQQVTPGRIRNRHKCVCFSHNLLVSLFLHPSRIIIGFAARIEAQRFRCNGTLSGQGLESLPAFERNRGALARPVDRVGGKQ